VDTLLGAIDVMQERIAQARLVSEPPEVLLTPRLGQLGPFEYYRAAMAITEGRESVIKMLPAIDRALAG
jgi:NTE family protein